MLPAWLPEYAGDWPGVFGVLRLPAPYCANATVADRPSTKTIVIRLFFMRGSPRYEKLLKVLVSDQLSTSVLPASEHFRHALRFPPHGGCPQNSRRGATGPLARTDPCSFARCTQSTIRGWRRRGT